MSDCFSLILWANWQLFALLLSPARPTTPTPPSAHGAPHPSWSILEKILRYTWIERGMLHDPFEATVTTMAVSGLKLKGVAWKSYKTLLMWYFELKPHTDSGHLRLITHLVEMGIIGTAWWNRMDILNIDRVRRLSNHQHLPHIYCDWYCY